MTRHIFTIVLITFVAVGAASSGAETRWQTLAPTRQGFSIEIPGERQTNTSPDLYIYLAGLHSFTVFVQPVNAELRKLVGDRTAATWCLEQVRDKMVANTNSTVLTSSPGEFEGYASLRFSNEGVFNGLALEGSYLMVLTETGLYVLNASAPKGLPNPHAERFFKSFRLLNAGPASTTVRSNHAPTPSDPIAARLAGPMLAVARLITTEEVNPLIDRLLQNAPGAARLGSRWDPSSAAWQQARSAITNRIALINRLYEESGQIVELLESRLGELSRSDADAIRTALAGPQAAAIVRGQAFITFAAGVRSDDPAPEVGTPAYNQRLRRLRDVFDEHAAPVMPGGRRPGEILDYVQVPGSDQLMSVWHSVVGKAAVDLRGAINLMMFDERERIMRDIESAIARAK